MDLRNEFAKHVTSTSSFSEIVNAFFEISRIPIKAEIETFMFSASRNVDLFDDVNEHPLFGSFSNYSNKTFCVQFTRTCELPSPDNGIIDFYITIGYPNELWNLMLVDVYLADDGIDEFIKVVSKKKAYQYLMTHDCRPDFVQVQYEETK